VGIGLATISSASSFVQTIIGSCTYVLVLALTGGIPAEVWELIPGSRLFWDRGRTAIVLRLRSARRGDSG
jgi:hypothetical protein